MPATVEEIIEEIRRAVPAYARPLEGAFGQAIRTGVERALWEFLDDVEGKPREEEPGRDMYVQLGRGEARLGRSMEALLAAYRVGARVAWRRASATGREAGFDSETLALLAEAFFAYIDELSARSAQGFAEEQSAVAGEAARRRRALLGLMVQTPPADAASIEEAAREAGWELPQSAGRAGLARRLRAAGGPAPAAGVAGRAARRRPGLRARARRRRAGPPRGARGRARPPPRRAGSAGAGRRGLAERAPGARPPSPGRRGT